MVGRILLPWLILLSGLLCGCRVLQPTSHVDSQKVPSQNLTESPDENVPQTIRDSGEDDWAFVGEIGRGIPQEDETSTNWFERLLTSRRSRRIERNLGVR